MVGPDERDDGVGGNGRPGFRDDATVDQDDAGQNQSAGTFARWSEPSLHHDDVQPLLQARHTEKVIESLVILPAWKPSMPWPDMRGHPKMSRRC
jgi:hypothetical protein